MSKFLQATSVFQNCPVIHCEFIKAFISQRSMLNYFDSSRKSLTDFEWKSVIMEMHVHVITKFTDLHIYSSFPTLITRWWCNMTNIAQKKMMQYFPEIQVFVCCLWSVFFCTAVQFFCKKKIETDWIFFLTQIFPIKN
jgi:hypothetical protein